MEHYEELLEQLQNIVNHGNEQPAEYCTNRCGGCDACDKSIDAIETLLAERDTAIKFLKSGKNRCASCAYNYHSIHDYPCKHCKETGGMSDYWEWYKPQKHD